MDIVKSSVLKTLACLQSTWIIFVKVQILDLILEILIQ